MKRPSPCRRRRPGAFTLVELLVVVAIIAILVAILLPSLRRAQDLAELATCKNNQRLLVLAAQNYAAANNGEAPQGFGALYLDAYKDDPTATPYYAWGADDRGGMYLWYRNVPMSFGLAYRDGYIQDPHVFYCPTRSPPRLHGYESVHGRGWTSTETRASAFTQMSYFYRYVLLPGRAAPQLGIIGMGWDTNKGQLAPVRSYRAKIDFLANDQPAALWDSWYNESYNFFHPDGFNIAFYDGSVGFATPQQWNAYNNSSVFPANMGPQGWPYDATDCWDSARSIPSFQPFADSIYGG